MTPPFLAELILIGLLPRLDPCLTQYVYSKRHAYEGNY